MGSYVLRRCLLVAPTVLGVSLLSFGVGHLSGDPAGRLLRAGVEREPTPGEVAAARRDLGLDRPLAIQYASWARRAAVGDLGASYTRGTPVRDELTGRFRSTLRLALPAAALVLLLALPLGITCAAYHNRLIDQVLRVVSLLVASVPAYWAAFLLIDLFAVRLGLLPAGGSQGLDSMVLPVLALSLGSVAVLARFIRSSMIDALGEDYIRTASAKGLRWQLVVERHALRNSLLPLVTAFGATFGRLLAGAVIIETIFAWPGIGTLALTAIREQDFPVLQGFVLYTGMLFVTVNLLVDLSYRLLDPRVRLGGRPVAQ